MAEVGAEVLPAARSEAKGAAALARIREEVPGADVSLRTLGLASLKSVAGLGDRPADEGRPIHLLINNGGVMAPATRHTTADGFELQFGTDYVGHLALTARLLSLPTAGPAPHEALMTRLACRGVFVHHVERGVLPILHAAASPQAQGGRLLWPDWFGQFTGGPAELPMYRAARDEGQAA